MARRNLLSTDATAAAKPSVLRPVLMAASLEAPEIGADGSIGSIRGLGATNIVPIAPNPEVVRQALEAFDDVAPSSAPAAEREAEALPVPTRRRAKVSAKPLQSEVQGKAKQKYQLHWPSELLESLRNASVHTRRPMNTIAIEAIRGGLKGIKRESAPDAAASEPKGQGAPKQKYPLYWPRDLLASVRSASELVQRPVNSIAIEAIEKGLLKLQRETNNGDPFPARDREPQVGRRCS